MSSSELARLGTRVEALEAHRRELDDERAIRNLLGLYGVYADSGDHERFVDLFTDDGVIGLIGGAPSVGSTAGDLRWVGRDEIRAFIEDPDMHMRIEGRSMHLPSIGLRIEVRDAEAVAESCSLVLVEEDGAPRLYGAGFTRWLLRKQDGRWLIASRTRTAIGTPEASDGVP